jgi:plastocyanin
MYCTFLLFASDDFAITKVTLANFQKGMTHDVDSGDWKSFSSPDMKYKAAYCHTFKKAGRYPYDCSFHGAPGRVGMSGVVIVKK